MEITLEKIELVKDRTGVSYKEAKEALEAAEGSVVDAIIAIESNVDLKKEGKVNEYVNDTVSKVKELVSKGNVTKISVKKGDETIVNIPVSVGIVGAVVAPWGILAAAVAAFGFKCKVEITTDDGKIINVSEKTDNFTSQIKDKGSVVVDEIKGKVPGAYEKVVGAGTEVFNDIKGKAPVAFKDVVGAATEKFNEVKDKFAGKEEAAEEEMTVDYIFEGEDFGGPISVEDVEEIKEEAKEEIQAEASEDAGEIKEEIVEEASEAAEEIKEEIQEGISEVKEEIAEEVSGEQDDLDVLDAILDEIKFDTEK